MKTKRNNLDQKFQTARAYNRNAILLANKFGGFGARVADIEKVFKIVGKKNPKVLEIGCASGRDAEEILKRTSDYTGIDISTELVRLAKQRIPNGKFEVADVASFAFPDNIDIIFAFASLVHTEKIELKIILGRMLSALTSLGVVHFDLKYADTYKEVTKKDKFGARTYYLYSERDIVDVVKGFKILKNGPLDWRGQKWLEVILQKPQK